ncbi:hypothetical protein SUGI_0476090 [Cryptomeria japonica]|uniref:dynamin-related protein 4C isoform X2 n=1 Tax=Cryptomeria japonica TaxID=3369 RepID=UPI002408E14D|nr:dynamin-related protein 4C isoform X2 [Cryptomeria japonica]GLJ24889.1 hypothetical protein SUGI_0476090 [Cryptomeria japonica]
MLGAFNPLNTFSYYVRLCRELRLWQELPERLFPERLFPGRAAAMFLEESGDISSMPEKLHLDISYNERIRPLLDAVDTLRNLGVMKEGIQLPSIVVVGDQSSGKSSVLESLAGISLPKGHGICTRVPLIMRLQSCKSQETQITIQYSGITRSISEAQITEALNVATEEIAGPGKEISNTPITLNVSKFNAPDLTMVDLPGITRVPVHGQPQDIYEQIARVIKQYITPKESIILNVLSASVDFPTCESIRMSLQVDEKGERTLAVVTKVDKAAEGLLEKVTVDAVNIGLGYVCVRNRIGNESNAQARQTERELFSNDPHLSKIDKSMVGIPVLAERLMKIQALGISKCLPDIVRKIDTTLSKRQAELNSLPRHFSSSVDATIEFMRLMDSIKGIIHRLLIQGNTENFQDEPEMNCIACLTRMFKSYSRDLLATNYKSTGNLLVEEVNLLEEARGLSLPNFLPHSVFLNLLQSRMVSFSERSRDLALQACDYLDKVICRVIDLQTECYPQLQSASRRAFQALMDRKKDECVRYVEDALEMHKTIVYTENPSYTEFLQRMQEFKKRFMEAINQNSSSVEIEGMGQIDLQKVPKTCDLLEAALEMKMSLMAYWSVVRIRLADDIPLHLRFVFQKIVQNDLVSCIMKEVMGEDFTKIGNILEECSATTNRRRNLIKSVDLLRESKSALSKIM